MGFIAGFLGNGLALVAIAVGVLVLTHIKHAPKKVRPWVIRGVILIMYGAGALLAVEGLGNLAANIAARLEAILPGSIGPSIITIASVFMIASLVVGLIWAPVEAVAYSAVMVPIVISLVPGGAIHSFYLATTVPAAQFAASLNTWLAG